MMGSDIAGVKLCVFCTKGKFIISYFSDILTLRLFFNRHDANFELSTRFFLNYSILRIFIESLLSTSMLSAF